VARVVDKLGTPWVVVLGVLVVVVALNGLQFYPNQQRLEVPTTDTAAALPSMEGKRTALQTPLSKEEKAPVVVEVADAPAGLSVYEDGQLVVDEVTEPGFSQEFEPEEALTISTDNAGAVRTEVGGWDLGPLGAGGEGVTRDLRLNLEQ
jgi:glucose/arabinose dehydrogenase